MVSFRNTQPRLRRNERVKRRIAPAFFFPVDRLLDRLRRSLDSEGTAREAQFFL